MEALLQEDDASFDDALHLTIADAVSTALAPALPAALAASGAANAAYAALASIAAAAAAGGAEADAAAALLALIREGYAKEDMQTVTALLAAVLVPGQVSAGWPSSHSMMHDA